ncbi:MAG TPA: cytochrome P450 [Solirubrobacterales bacterium]|nr:cytochrome P450 [Solirubrobacterales bacterium]
MSVLPPGPRKPRSLQTLDWMRHPLPLLEECQRRYGDIFTLRLRRWGEWVLLCDPEDVKTVFTAGEKVGVAVANPLLRPVLGLRSVMLLEEPAHMTRRRLMLPSFHGEAVAADAAMMSEVCQREVEGWPLGEPFELWPRMQAITQRVVMRAVFGPDEGAHPPGLDRKLTALTEWMNTPRNLTKLALLGPDRLARSRGYREAMGPVEAAVLAEARRRRAADEAPPGVVTMLARARYEDGAPLSERELRDELLTLLTDGPTSTSLAWTFERLMRNPEKLERARGEVLSGGDGAYVDAVIKETLRMRPPVPVVVRRLLAPLELGGYRLPRGTTVAPCVPLIHNRPEYYPEPERFLPERFLGVKTPTYAWIPFGGGVRRCLAASYAEMEMKRVLRTVLAMLDLEPVDERQEGMRKSAISFSPDRSARVVAARRGVGRPPASALAAA